MDNINNNIKLLIFNYNKNYNNIIYQYHILLLFIVIESLSLTVS